VTAVMRRSATVRVSFEKRSDMTNAYRLPSTVFSSGPRMSMPTTVSGYFGGNKVMGDV